MNLISCQCITALFVFFLTSGHNLLLRQQYCKTSVRLDPTYVPFCSLLLLAVLCACRSQQDELKPCKARNEIKK